MKINKKVLMLSLVAIGCAVQVVPVMAQTMKVNQNTVGKVSATQTNNYERQIVNVNGENMSYIQLGNVKSNKSIVIIHGSAYSAKAMIPYGELYANDGYNVVLVDMPGHYGDISEVKTEFTQLGDSIASLMDKLVSEKKLKNKSEVQGWSLGGSIALDIASRHPEHVKSVGSIDSSSYWGIDLGHVTEDDKIAQTVGNIQFLKSQAVSQEVTDRLIADLPNVIASADAINSDFAIDRVLNVDGQLSQIKVPVYNFFGADDMLTTLDKQTQMMDSIKHGDLYVAEGYNHFAVLENPQLVHDAFVSMHNTDNGSKK